MKKTDKDSYLGDILNCTGDIKNTVEDRVAKGHGIVADIMSILSEIPLGKYKMNMGLKL